MRAPLDEHGFVEAFELSDEAGIRAFYERFGFVVVRDVLTADEAELTVQELWAEMGALSAGSVRREDPSTWGDIGLVTSKAGIVRGSTVAAGRRAWENRQNPRLHRAFQIVRGPPGSPEGEQLLASVDRMCFMRPTAGAHGKEEWRTTSKWVHWDENPWKDAAGLDNAEAMIPKANVWSQRASAGISFITEGNNVYHPDFRKVQGLVALTDAREESGGFCCVPGFHKRLEEYCAARTPISEADFVQLPDGDPLGDEVQKISMRAGSLVIWSSRLPHCNYPCDDDRGRACQYIKMLPRRFCGSVRERGRAIERLLPPGFTPSETGQRVFGLGPAPWSPWTLLAATAVVAVAVAVALR